MAVQISGNDITVPRDGSFTRNVTIGGTLTYEDVTNIDSVGLVTARTGIEIGARPGVAASISVDGNMVISGISTFSDIIDVTGSNSTVRLGSNASRRLMYRSGENDIVLEAASNFFYRQKISDTSHRWYTNGADEKLMITGAGLVGINSASPTHNLDIHASGNPYLKLLRSGYNPVYIGNAAGEGVIETTGATFIKTGGSERLRITGIGSVGVGINAPTAQLQVNSTKNAETDRHDATNYHLALRNPADDNGEAIGLSFGITSNATKVGAAILHERDGGGSQGSLQFYTSGDGNSLSERFRINSTGNAVLGNNATVAGLRYLDVQNSSTAASNHGAILRLISSNAAGNSTASLDMVKYKDGNFFLINNESVGTTNFNTGGATRLTIDQNGIVKKPYTPSFFVTINGTDATTNAAHNIPWNVVKHNNGSHYSTSGYYFTAPVDGFYYFFAQLWAKNGTSNARFHYYYEDASNSYAGDQLQQSGFHANGVNHQDRAISASIVWAMDAGDRMAVRPDNTNLTYYTAGASDPHSYFCGYMIG